VIGASADDVFLPVDGELREPEMANYDDQENYDAAFPIRRSLRGRQHDERVLRLRQMMVQGVRKINGGLAGKR
jgi:hypothetical protein